MRANDIPTPTQLRLGVALGIDGLEETIRTIVGDPAYLYEMGPHLARWSRKQIEKAMDRLVDDGHIIRYGQRTRRLYASRRPAGPVIAALSAKQVRLLQYMPDDGAVEHARMTGRMSETAPAVKDLEKRGILTVSKASRGRQLLRLTAKGQTARSDLGTGLMMPAITDPDLIEVTAPRRRARRDDVNGQGADMRRNHETASMPPVHDVPPPATGNEREQDMTRTKTVDPAILERVTWEVQQNWRIPRPLPLAQRTATRNALAEFSSNAIRKAAQEVKLELSVVGVMADDILRKAGAPSPKTWFTNTIYHHRLANRNEIEAIARVLGVSMRDIGPHLDLASWTISEGRRGGMIGDTASDAVADAAPEIEETSDSQIDAPTHEAWNPATGVAIDGDPLCVVMANIGGHDADRLLRAAHDLETAVLVLRLIAERRTDRPV